MTFKLHLVSRTILAFGLLALAAAALAAGEWDKCSRQTVLNSFEEGAWCLEAQRWKAAIPWLKDEVRNGPEADADDVRSLYGKLAKFRYLPYFYLGFCYSEENDCPRALDCFEEATRQGQVETIKKLSRLLGERRKTCLDKIAVVQASNGSTEMPPTSALPTAVAVCSELRREP